MQKFFSLLIAMLSMPMTWAATIINDQPEGNIVSYNFTGYSTTVQNSDVQSTYISGGRSITDVVYAPDGQTVYMRNILPTVYSQAWIKGEISEDGSQLTFPLGQPLAASDFGTQLLVTCWIEGNVENDILDIKLRPDVENMVFTKEENGTLTLNGSTGDAEMHDVQGIAIIQQSNQSFYGYMSYGISLEPSNKVPLVAPEGLQTETFTFESGLEGRRRTRLCQIAFDGNYVWMNGLADPDYGERWARGTYSPATNQIIIPSGQYLGTWRGYSFYWQGVNSEKYDDPQWGYVTRYLPADAMVFDYDPVTRHMTSDMTLLFTTDTANVFAYVVHHDKPIVKPYVEQAVTPATPKWLMYNDESFDKFGALISYELPKEDINGEYIDPANLSFRLFVDNETEPYLFNPDQYEELPEPMTEIPCTYSDYYDFTESMFFMHDRGFQRLGLQSVCRIGDDVCYSEIAWYEFHYDAPDYHDPDFTQFEPAEGGRGDSQVLYGNYRGNVASIGTIGFGVAQDYDIAMRINDPNLIGCTVTALRIPVQLPAKATNYRAWLSHELKVKDNQMMPDITTVLFDPKNMWTEVTLAEPYVIDKPFFAGFSFTVTEAQDNYSKKPLVVCDGADDNGVWIRSSRTYRSFEDFSHRYSRDCSCPIVLVLNGDLRLNAAAISAVMSESTMKNEPFNATVTLRNHGSLSIHDIDIQYEIDGLAGTQHFSFDADSIASEYYNEDRNVVIDLPAVEHNGSLPLSLTVTQVNGLKNEELMPRYTTEVIVLGNRPVHRAVLEEYTGLWCGWCPRGFVGLQRMNEMYPEDFIGISYHNGDPMEVLYTSEYPSSPMSFPAAYMDRKESTDAYGGDNDGFPFGIDKVWQRHSEELAIAAIEATASFSAEDDSMILVNTSVDFIRDIQEANYSLGYVLTHDRMYDRTWIQTNYYNEAGDDYIDDPLMVPFVNGQSYVAGLKFDDVAIFAKDVKGIAGSLPNSIEVNHTYQHDYSVDLRKAISTEGNNLVQDRGRLYVVVLLIDNKTKTIANAFKVRPAHEIEAIEHIQSDPKASSQRYNIGGQITQAKQGLIITTHGIELRR